MTTAELWQDFQELVWAEERTSTRYTKWHNARVVAMRLSGRPTATSPLPRRTETWLFPDGSKATLLLSPREGCPVGFDHAPSGGASGG
jgi:hypothetical protein